MIKKLMQYFWFQDLLAFFGYKPKELESGIYTKGGAGGAGGASYGGVVRTDSDKRIIGYCKVCGHYDLPIGEQHKCSTASNL